MINNKHLGRKPLKGDTPLCKQCGRCCQFSENGGPLTKCPHLGIDNLCTIYEDRPPMCRDWWCLEAYRYGRALYYDEPKPLTGNAPSNPGGASP